MFAKQALIAITLAAAGTAAMADDITIADDSFVATQTRAEVRAEVLRARAAGVLQFTSEFDSLVQPAVTQPASTLTRDAVRAQLLKSPRAQVMAYNPAA